ncbi:unnamed protein product [Durusdinium trenchii]|uniref:Uncharacterized protein n=1 Tax=Durusdinium trenchii TaxID=1381693 RepID=A0ABP0QL49_9DINO
MEARGLLEAADGVPRLEEDGMLNVIPAKEKELVDFAEIESLASSAFLDEIAAIEGLVDEDLQRAAFGNDFENDAQEQQVSQTQQDHCHAVVEPQVFACLEWVISQVVTANAVQVSADQGPGYSIRDSDPYRIDLGMKPPGARPQAVERPHMVNGDDIFGNETDAHELCPVGGLPSDDDVDDLEHDPFLDNPFEVEQDRLSHISRDSSDSDGVMETLEGLQHDEADASGISTKPTLAEGAEEDTARPDAVERPIFVSGDNVFPTKESLGGGEVFGGLPDDECSSVSSTDETSEPANSKGKPLPGRRRERPKDQKKKRSSPRVSPRMSPKGLPRRSPRGSPKQHNKGKHKQQSQLHHVALPRVDGCKAKKRSPRAPAMKIKSPGGHGNKQAKAHAAKLEQHYCPPKHAKTCSKRNEAKSSAMHGEQQDTETANERPDAVEQDPMLVSASEKNAFPRRESCKEGDVVFGGLPNDESDLDEDDDSLLLGLDTSPHLPSVIPKSTKNKRVSKSKRGFGKPRKYKTHHTELDRIIRSNKQLSGGFR